MATRTKQPVAVEPVVKPPAKPVTQQVAKPATQQPAKPVTQQAVKPARATRTRPSTLAAALPESLTIDVTLPRTVHSTPADELAVAIVTVPVDPGQVEVAQPTTTSIDVVATATNPTPVVQSALEAIPARPSDDDLVYDRRARMRGEVSGAPEPAAMLTSDRLLQGKRRKRAAPEGGVNEFLYKATLHAVNRGDSPAVQARKRLDARIARKFEGGTRFVPVLTRKGGVGKTTITALLGMALAEVRDDRVIAVDANPDRGTLSERVNKQTRSTVRDIVTNAPSITTFNDFAAMVSRDETRLDILASDTDPLLSEAFDENDYNVVADLASKYYSIMLTDCGTGIVHSVMRATLRRADAVVIVSGGSVDEARLASETLTWLEANGYGDLVKNAIVALNTATQGTNLVKLEEIEAHFRSRVREIVRMPYDPMLAAGSVINFKDLKPLTRSSARDLAALVMDGIPLRQTS